MRRPVSTCARSSRRSPSPLRLVLNWTVHAEGQPSAVVFSGRAANPYIPVPPGRYVVQARDGGIAASTVAATAEKGPTLVELALNAGMLQVRAQAEKTGAPLSEAIITISGPEGAPLAAFKGSEGVAALPPGRYVVRVEQGLVRAEQPVTVQAGSQANIDIPLSAAHLQLSAVGREIAESERAADLQHRRGRPRRAERPTRGGAFRGAAGGVRAGAGHLLRDCQARHDRGARKPGRRARRRGQAHAVRGGRPARAHHQAARQRAGRERARLLSHRAPRQPGCGHDQPAVADSCCCRAAATASKAVSGR